MTASWGIVMTVREPAQLVLANVAWHLGTGASEVHVYLDDPDDPVADALEAIPAVRVVPCDAAHWGTAVQTKTRPESINRRQGRNAGHAMARCAVDWLIHLDADEFLLQERPLGHELEAVRELDCELHFPVHERTYAGGAPIDTIFSGIFRTTTKGLNRRSDGRSNDPIIFGTQSPVLHHGVLGHSAGKCAAPTDGDFRLGLHWSFRGLGRERAERYRSTSTRLLHFDGLTRLHWLSKLIRYRDTDPSVLKVPPHRRAQIEIFQDISGDRAALADFHRTLREPDDAALGRLRAFGLLHERAFDPSEVVERVLGHVPDLTPQRFDADLIKAHPGLSALQ